jgi:hypothetical protein
VVQRESFGSLTACDPDFIATGNQPQLEIKGQALPHALSILLLQRRYLRSHRSNFCIPTAVGFERGPNRCNL